MAISIKHKFQSAKADGADASIVRPSNWNDQHDLTLAASRLLGRHTASAGPAEEVALGNGLSFSAGVLNVDVINKMATDTAAAVVKADPVDADSVMLVDSADANKPKKLTWARIKAVINAVSKAGDTLTSGYIASSLNGGTIAAGEVYSPNPRDRNMHWVTNGGAFTLAATNITADTSMVVAIVNGAGSGIPTLTGFHKVTGDTFTTTSTHRFFVFITRINGRIIAQVAQA